jgi:acetyltransferase-like isoleucine patch superfamily enzyme
MNILFRNILKSIRNKFNSLIIQISNKYSAGPVSMGDRVVIPNRRGLKLGENTRIGDEVKIFIERCENVNERPKIYIGNKVKIGDRVVLSVYNGEFLSIANEVSMQSGCVIIGDVEIGRGTLLSSNIYISSRNHNFDKSPSMSIREQDIAFGQAGENRAVVIGEDCWLGWGVVVGQGLKIGRGSIVGSNSVVRKDIPPYEVWGGVPAKFLRKRIKDESIVG